MCPMRVFLVLFSAMLAGYLAWRNLSKSEALSAFSCPEEENEAKQNAKEMSSSVRQMRTRISSGFWMLVDMASGRYLWQNLRSTPASQEVKAR